jgi:hypothetical protein
MGMSCHRDQRYVSSQPRVTYCRGNLSAPCCVTCDSSLLGTPLLPAPPAAASSSSPAGACVAGVTASITIPLPPSLLGSSDPLLSTLHLWDDNVALASGEAPLLSAPCQLITDSTCETQGIGCGFYCFIAAGPSPGDYLAVLGTGAGSVHVPILSFVEAEVLETVVTSTIREVTNQPGGTLYLYCSRLNNLGYAVNLSATNGTSAPLHHMFTPNSSLELRFDNLGWAGLPSLVWKAALGRLIPPPRS